MFIGHSLTDKKNIKEIIEKKSAKIYFIGIGGVSMSALSELSMSLGLRIYGSDKRRSDATERLIKRGAAITYSHGKNYIYRTMPDLIVYSLAIDSSNPEYTAASELGIPAISRAEYMGVLIERYKNSIGVSGSHGKSTVTAMLYSILKEAEMLPTVIGGAEIFFGSSFVNGEGESLVYESCEYGDSFLNFSPSIAVMLNLDFDHTDYFKTIDDIKKSFISAADLAKGAVILNADDENLRYVAEKTKSRVITFSENDGCDFKYIKHPLGGGLFEFRLYRGREFCGKFSPGTRGAFNVTNAAAAAIAAISCGISSETIAKALSEFKGIPRRIEFLHNYKNADVFYDYAHHPKEISATKDALISMGYNNICVIFAPHTYTRTKTFFNEFARELSEFSYAFITDIYGARENPIVGVSASSLAAAVRENGGRSETVCDGNVKELLEGSSFDCIVLMGAGDLENIKKQIIDV